jgi:thiamine pyrophosphate-dependent acetolactate synthase large subunit-like protein
MIGAILSTSLQAKGLFGAHEYDIGISGSYGCQAAEPIFAQADFVLGVGAEVGQYTTDGGAFFPRAKFARIDNAPPPLTLAIAPGLYIQGDARKTLTVLNEELEARQVRKTGLRTAAVKALLEATPAADPAPTDGLDPRKLMRTLSSCLPREALITCGIGHFAGFPAAYLSLPADAEMQFSLSFGAVGQTLPISIGIGVSRPNRPHIVIEGDGSLFMNLQELETVVRHNIQMVLIVFNDSGLGAEVHKLRKGGFDPGLAQWRSPDFVKLAQALGGDGIVLTNEDEIEDAVERGLNIGGLFLVDARVSQTTRSDAYQRTHFGVKNKAPRLRP